MRDHFSNFSYLSREARWQSILIILFKGLLILLLNERKILCLFLFISFSTSLVQVFINSNLASCSSTLNCFYFHISLPSIVHQFSIQQLSDFILTGLCLCSVIMVQSQWASLSSQNLSCSVLRTLELLFCFPKQLFLFFPTTQLNH